jgi:hypothetical protein
MGETRTVRSIIKATYDIQSMSTVTNIGALIIRTQS